MRALGMIETRGMLPCIVAADAMLKTAEVTLSAEDKVGGGLVAVFVTGEVAATQAAVAAGVAAIEQFHCLVSFHVIARPVEELQLILNCARLPPPAVPSDVLREENRGSWDEAYLEGLKVVELRRLAREAKLPKVTYDQIRDGKKETSSRC